MCLEYSSGVKICSAPCEPSCPDDAFCTIEYGDPQCMPHYDYFCTEDNNTSYALDHCDNLILSLECGGVASCAGGYCTE